MAASCLDYEIENGGELYQSRIPRTGIVNRIMMNGDKVGLGEHRTISDEDLKWFANP
jgi:hypothetical protein